MKSLSLETHDASLFNCFRNTFDKKYKAKFNDEKLFDTWDKKCRHMINFMKFLSQTIGDVHIRNSINLFLEFIRDKDCSDSDKNLASFSGDFFCNHTDDMLYFRNLISISFFKLIIIYEKRKESQDKIFASLEETTRTYISKQFKFLNNLIELVKFCFSDKVNAYKEFFLLVNNKDINSKIIQSPYCILNTNQKKFLTNIKFNIDECPTILEKKKKKKKKKKKE